jgi:hypothetical protein
MDLVDTKLGISNQRNFLFFLIWYLMFTVHKLTYIFNWRYYENIKCMVVKTSYKHLNQILDISLRIQISEKCTNFDTSLFFPLEIESSSGQPIMLMWWTFWPLFTPQSHPLFIAASSMLVGWTTMAEHLHPKPLVIIWTDVDYCI